MVQFISLREFCLLKDPTDYDPPRDTLASGIVYGAPPFAASRGWSMGRCSVARYDVAKESWERFGDAGPPPGTKVVLMTSGEIVTMAGVFERNPWHFELEDSRAIRRIVERSQWWVWLAPADHPVATDRNAYLRWENIVS